MKKTGGEVGIDYFPTICIMNSEKKEYFKDYIKSKNIAVIGLGKSNLPLINFLLKFTDKITAFDKLDKDNIKDIVESLSKKGVSFSLGENYLENLKGFDIIYKTPGMHPQASFLKKEEEMGAIITSEMELFFDLCPAKIFGITGSDGKTTTTSIIYNILKEEGYNCYLGGNIGRPLIEDLEKIKEDDMVVVELSSFQLLTMKQSPHVSVITNITPNHLDVHTSMQEYIEAKMNIFIKPLAINSNKRHIVLNYDNAITNSFGKNEDECYAKECESYNKFLESIEEDEFLFYSTRQNLESGIVLDKNWISLVKDEKITPVLDKNDICIPGIHNVENYMAAIGAVKEYVRLDSVRKVAKTFNGVEHRIEYVDNINGVSFFNDSIASSPVRTMAGLRSFEQKVILIAGGCDKKLDYMGLGFEMLDSVKNLILVGQTTNNILSSFEIAKKASGRGDDIGVFVETEFESAIKKAFEISEQNDIVLLSPASTSFDLFKNFEERGNVFKQIVNDLKKRF